MSDIIERLIAPSLSNINANDTENDSVDEGDEDNQWKRSLIPSEVIKDRCKAVKIIFTLFGVLGTVPWNFFITTNEYWEYKFRNVSEDGPYDPSKRNELQAKFESYLSICSMIPAVLGILMCASVTHKCSNSLKMLLSLSVVAVLFCATIIFTRIDTDSWQLTFFCITLTSVIVMNGVIAFFQANAFGIAGIMGPRFVAAVMNGQAIGGIIASVGRIITLFVDASDPTLSAMSHFVAAEVFLVAGVAAYLIVIRTKFYKFNYSSVVEDHKLLILNDDEALPFKDRVKLITSKIRCHAVGVVLVFVVTLAVYPAITSLVISVNWHSPSPWTGKYFLPVTCFLLFNCGDFCGRYIASRIALIKPNSALMIVICILRIVFIPLFLLCNAQPRYNLPVLLHSDVSFIILICALSVSNGYLASLIVADAPRQVPNAYQDLTGIIMSLFMSIGVSIGALLSNVVVRCL